MTCTFTNRKRGKIVVVKDAAPDDPQDFSFTAGGGLSPDELQPRRRLGRHAVEHATFTNVAPGQRLLAGGERAGRLGPDRRDCDDGSPVSDIDVSAGETVTCTFLNTKRGQITVVKDATRTTRRTSPSPRAAGPPSTSTLDDDADGTLSNTRTFTERRASRPATRSRRPAERLGPDRADLRRRQPR